jgi:phi13 family phage major tail protein
MATIGMDKLYYAKITEDAEGHETYDTPKALAKAMKADLSIELAEATLYADDAAAEVYRTFKSGTISLGVDDLADGVAEDLTGAKVDSNGVLISTVEDISAVVAIGFRAQKANGKYRYFWLYRVVFAIPATSLQTKGDSITFSTPTIEGTVLRRNKPNTQGKHPWKAEVTEGATGVSANTITDWYKTVYEPTYTDAANTEE